MILLLMMMMGGKKALVIATTWTFDLNGGSGGWFSRTVRQIILASAISTSGVKIRITVECVSGVEGCHIDNVAIVERDGSTSNGTTTPTEILFGGTSGIDVGGASEEVSDWLTYSLDETKDYLMIFDIGDDTANDIVGIKTSGGGSVYWKALTNSYNAQNLVGATTYGNWTVMVNKIEVMY